MVNAQMKAEVEARMILAMYDEAYAFAKYMLFADQARLNGNNDLAEVFEKAACVELHDHFANAATMAGVIRSDAENLRDAINSESYEIDTLYREFVASAVAAGDSASSEWFTKVRKAEVKHREAFKQALLKLEAVPV